MDGQFRSRFFQAEELAMQLRRAIALVKSGTVTPQEGMEQLGCIDAASCLAGAIFACLTYPNDFDSAIITAVNHSGLSAATGAMVGAILGARLGDASLPEFYLESLECIQPLNIIAEDILRAAPTLSVFDDSWDHKYVQGLPPEGIAL
jgi:ADP-ribosylglycohydrolase